MLAETGYGGSPDDSNADRVVVRQRSDMRGTEVASSGGGSTYGADGLPVLDASTPSGAAVKASSSEVPPVRMRPIHRSPIFPAKGRRTGHDAGACPYLPKPTGSIAGAADAQARAMTGFADAAPSQQPLHQMNPSGDAQPSAPEPAMHQMNASADAPAPAPEAEPALHQMNAGADTGTRRCH